jgi:hypothetical protein
MKRIVKKGCRNRGPVGPLAGRCTHVDTGTILRLTMAGLLRPKKFSVARLTLSVAMSPDHVRDSQEIDGAMYESAFDVLRLIILDPKAV